MTATSGLMAGTQIFRDDESSILYESNLLQKCPCELMLTINSFQSYPRGLLIMIALVVAGLVLVALQDLIYFILNRRKKSGFQSKRILHIL